MVKKMSLMGVGGKIAAVFFIFAAAGIWIHSLYAPLFTITDHYETLVIVAAAAAAAGFTLNLAAAFGMLRAHRNGQLATGGLYAVFLNPMYTFQILITIPGLLLFFNSWLVLMSVVPTFIAFKIFAKEEEKYLDDKFGSRYRDYKKRVLFKFL